MSALGINMANQNVSLLTVPAVLFLSCMAPHVYAAALSRGAHDNASPRGFRDNVAKSESLSKAMKERIYRAEGASQNGFETLGFYAAAVVAANMAGLGTAELNALTLGYLASRLAFVVVYVHFQTNRKWAGVRSLMWGTGTIMATSLWIRAGLAVMRSGKGLWFKGKAF